MDNECWCGNDLPCDEHILPTNECGEIDCPKGQMVHCGAVMKNLVFTSFDYSGDKCQRISGYGSKNIDTTFQLQSNGFWVNSEGTAFFSHGLNGEYDVCEGTPRKGYNCDKRVGYIPYPYFHDGMNLDVNMDGSISIGFYREQNWKEARVSTTFICELIGGQWFTV